MYSIRIPNELGDTFVTCVENIKARQKLKHCFVMLLSVEVVKYIICVIVKEKHSSDIMTGDMASYKVNTKTIADVCSLSY